MLFGLLLDFLLIIIAIILIIGGTTLSDTFKNKQYGMFFKTVIVTATIPVLWSIREYIRLSTAKVLSVQLKLEGSFNTLTEAYLKTLFKNAILGEWVVEVIIPVIFVLILAFIIYKISKGLYSDVKTQLKSI